MDKVLVERPRGGAGRRRKGRAGDLEDLPQKQGMGVGGTKYLSENLAPLRRYLAAQVGRPWDKVAGEMRANIKPGNTVQEHILTHIDDFLVLKAEKVEPSEAAPCGVRRVQGRGIRGLRVISEGTFYVDPDDGLIKRARRRLKGPRTAPVGDTRMRRLMDGSLAMQIDGLWWALELTPYSVAFEVTPRARTKLFQVNGQQFKTWDDPHLGEVRAGAGAQLEKMADYYGPDLLAKRLRPLPRTTLKQNHLKNEGRG